jgi:tight adherence protein B
MDAAAIGLLALVITSTVFLLGLRELVAGRARDVELRDRATAARPEPLLARLRRRLDWRIRSTALGERWVVRPLAAAGIDLPPHEFLALALAAALAGGVLSALVLPAWAAVLVGLACARGVWGWVEWKRRARRQAFVAQLPELAQLLSNGAAAGLSIAASLQMAAGELAEPARSEMRVVLEHMRIGQSLELALEHQRERMPSRELAVLVTTLVIQQRSGGDVVNALKNMSETLEQRKDLLREVRTLMSGAVFTGYVVAALGVGTVFLLNAISPGSLDRLLGSPAGIAAFAVAGVLYAAGLLLIRQVTRVDA